MRTLRVEGPVSRNRTLLFLFLRNRTLPERHGAEEDLSKEGEHVEVPLKSASLFFNVRITKNVFK
jgi:hypothetical protein